MALKAAWDTWDQGKKHPVIDVIKKKLRDVPGHINDIMGFDCDSFEGAAEDGFYAIHAPLKSTTFWKHVELEFFVRTHTADVYMQSRPNGCQDILLHPTADQDAYWNGDCYDLLNAVREKGVAAFGEKEVAELDGIGKLVVRVRRAGAEVALEFLAADEKTFSEMHETACAVVCALWRANTIPEIASVSVSFA
jgi:hypothetical protein